MSKYTRSSEKPDLQPQLASLFPAVPWFEVLAGIAIIVAAAFLAYLPSINGGFILDDDLLLTQNPLIKAPDGLYRFWCTTEAAEYYPVSNSTLWIEWRLWGMNSTGYHITNLGLHIAAAMLIWVILRKLSIPGAFFAALIFAVHPVNVESVAWIAQRKNMMAMLFLLLSILCYLKYFSSTCLDNTRRSRQDPSADPAYGVCGVHTNRWYWLNLAAFVLAMLGKGSVAILPVLLLGIVWWLRTAGTVPLGCAAKMDLSPSVYKWHLLRTAPFFVVAVVLTGVNIWFQTHGNEIVFRTAGFTERLLGAGGVVWFYLYKALLPVDLVFVYPLWHIDTANPLWWLPLLAALIVSAVLWRYRKSWGRPLLFAWGFFCVALIPVMGFTDAGFMQYSLAADYYQYIAMIAVIALASALRSIWHRHARGAERRAVNFVAVAAVGVLTFLTWRQSGLYHDAMTLYQATMEKNPECWMVHNNLGLQFAQEDRLQDAIAHYRQAMLLRPDYIETYNNLGNALLKTGRLNESIAVFQQALRLEPNHPGTHYNLGNALLQADQLQEAMEHYRQAQRLKFNRFEAYFDLGNALIKAGRPNEAIDQFKQALQFKPDYPDTHNNLGIALIQTGQVQEAIKHYEQALRLNPDYPEAHFNLGMALLQTDQPEKAIEHFEQALRLKPDYIEAHNNLGMVLVETGQPNEAIKHFEQSLRLKPDSPDAHNNLAAALIQTGRPLEAIEHYKQALALKPDFITVYCNLALAYAGMHQSNEAIAMAQKALEIAKSQGQTVQAKQVEDWLNSYQRGKAEGEEGKTER